MTETISQEQFRVKPKLEDVISAHADTILARDIGAFIDWCRTKKIAYPWSSTNTWTMKAKGKSIGIIRLGEKIYGKVSDENGWSVGVGLAELLQYDDIIIAENLQSEIFSKLKYCSNCNEFCSPGFDAEILGSRYRSLCRGVFILDAATCIMFDNPGADDIARAQRIIDFRLSIPHGTPKRPVFDAAVKEFSRIDNTASVILPLTDLNGGALVNNITKVSKTDNLFDGSYDTYSRCWANENNFDFVFRLREPAKIAMYSFVTSFQLQFPNSWRFYGATSADETWTLIDERGEFPKPAACYTEKAFAISAPETYRFYRFSFDRCKFDLSQIHLYTI